MNAPEAFSAARVDQRLIAVVVTPGADSRCIADALAAAAAACGAAVVREPAALTEPLVERTLFLCANASTLKSAPWRAAVIMGDIDTASVAAAMRGKQHSLREGFAFAAWCLAYASEFAVRTEAPVLRGSDLADGGANLLALLASLGLDGPHGELQRIAAGLAGELARLASSRPTLDPESEMLNSALEVYRGGLTGRSDAGWWDRSLFWLGGVAYQACPEVIDITGRRRNLFFGPGIALGPGHWRVTAHLELCDEAARTRFRFQFGPVADMAEEYVTPAGPGRYEIALEHSWTLPSAVEMRLFLNRPAFHGEVWLAGAAVERLSDTAVDPAKPAQQVIGAAS